MSDLISRADVKELISDIQDTVFGQTVIKGVEKLPSITPAQKIGHWTIEDRQATTYKYCCNECKAHHRAMYDFCPSCGADMRGKT